MTIKGDYSALATYSPGDAVKGGDGVWYVCIKTTTAGISYLNTDYFNKVIGDMVSVLDMLSALDARVYDLEHPTIVGGDS